MDRLQSMRVFAKVVEQGGFARAGAALSMSNAVVTRHVAELESHLGTRLLNRTTRKVSLTETGQAYLERLQPILRAVEDADAIASSASQRASGTLRLYAHQSFGQQQLASLLPAYSMAHPDVTLEAFLSERTVDLVEEGFDVGIFSGLQKFDASLIARKLCSSEIMLCASPAYLEQRGVPAIPEDVAQHDCLNFDFDQLRSHWTIEGPDGLMSVPIHSKLVSNNGTLLRECTLAGMGISINASYAVRDDLTSGRLVRLLPGYPMGQLSIALVYPSRRLLSAKVRSFIDFMAARFPHPESDPWADNAYGGTLITITPE
ncbi:MAG: LysR family transcriptional regulator [Herminiimonas sp.]|nr:LysR family transcriptional regulator [Herminiimonas sp.]